MIFGTAIAILTSVFPPGERGKALGIYITAVYFGLTVGPFLGGVLTENLGWRSIFFVNVPIGIIACLLILWKLEGEWAECEGERFDLAGSVIYAAALVCVMTGFSLVPAVKGPTYNTRSYGPVNVIDTSAILGDGLLHVFLTNRSLSDHISAGGDDTAPPFLSTNPFIDLTYCQFAVYLLDILRPQYGTRRDHVASPLDGENLRDGRGTV